MKILIINHFPLEGSGSGVYTQNIAISLMKKGHEVDVIMPVNTTNYLKIDGITMHPVYFKKEELIKDQLDFNFPCFTTHPESVQDFYSLNEEEIRMYEEAFKKEIDKIIHSNKPDIILAQHIWILSSLAVDTGIDTIITAHGTDLIGHKKDSKFHDYTYNATRKAKKIITISEDNKKIVKEIFSLPDEKIELMKNGYNPDKFYLDDVEKSVVLKEHNILKEYDKIVSFTGKLTHIKGIDTLLHANKIYDKENIVTLISGNGELREELTELKDKLGLKNTFFLGNQSHDNLRKIYNVSSVSVVPSRVEAFGLVAVEALACGTPVIASNQGGLPEIINEDVGKIFEVDNIKELAEKIEDTIQEDYNREFLNKYVYLKYSQDSIIEQLISLIKEVKNY